MPCTSGPTREEEREEREDRNTVTRLACEYCRRLGEGNIPEWATKWWKKHKVWDEFRLNEELAGAHRMLVRGQALNKLTAEERKALGL